LEHAFLLSSSVLRSFVCLSHLSSFVSSSHL
jgi:hypothetical protein